jgi:succinate dehydrogenase/fumarate reductase flavoprotein subunit
MEADVVIAGSGGAGLTAAILAHDHDVRVVVLERSDKVGGTTAVSGGGLWVPLNHHMSEVGVEDTRDEALTYCKAHAEGRVPDELIETFVDAAHEMVRYLEERTPLRLKASAMPDYRSEEPGAKLGGRTLEPEMFARSELGDWQDKLRPSPLMFVPLTMDEQMRSLSKPGQLPVQTVVERMQQGLLGSGQALAARLLKGCLARGIDIRLGVRARELVIDAGRVVGLIAEQEGRTVSVKARGGVVLASGGFEWNDAVRAQHLAGPLAHHCSPSSNEGDGLAMAIDAGAELGNMSESWAYPGAIVPGEEHDGRPVSRWVIAERTLPHSILVNRLGERFVNEGMNYNDVARALHAADPARGELRNLPCWAIMDAQYRASYPILTVMPGDPDPDWLIKDESLDALARQLGIDAAGLTRSVCRWNGLAREAKDGDFGRGESAYERWLGDQDALHPNLGTIEQAPFYALPVGAHSSGTKGGPRTNARGEVLSKRGDVIRGLYAAGNVMAGISGPGYYGGGGTIGLAMTWGYLCGRNAAARAKTDPA